MAFGGLILTNKGRNLHVKAQTGVQLNFTRIAIGDGDLGGSSILDLNALKHEVKTIAITKLKALTGGKAVVGGSFNNTALATGFYWKEIGVFAQDPNEGEILYCYGNAGANAEYIPAGGGADIIEKSVDVITIVGNAANISAEIDGSLVFYTQNDILAVDQTQAPATPGNGKIQQLFNWIANRIKAITGKLNWWDNPTKNLEQLNTDIVNHANAADPHTQYALDTNLADLASAHAAHVADNVQHITNAERTAWNSKAAGNHNHDTVYEPKNANLVKTNVAATMTAQLTAKTGTDYTTKQVRNIRFKQTSDFTTAELANGEIGFVYD